MEKTVSLAALDRDICEYHLKNNYSKKDNIFCYQPSRKQISQFYNSMADHFYQHHIKEPQHNDQRTRPHKVSSHIYQAVTDPLHACLPKKISQKNVIDSDCLATGMSTVPMFSELQASKKQKYFIAREVRELLGHDIKQMQKEKEEVLFRKHFPEKQAKNSIEQEELQTEQLVKEFNRLLIKYKNNKLNAPTSLNLLEKENTVNFMAADSTSDQKFKILNLFKKLYMETKSEDINQNLVDYLLKFHLTDKFSRKIAAKEGRKSKGRSKEQSAKPAQSILRRGKNQSQVNLMEKQQKKSNFFQHTQPTSIKPRPKKEIKLRSRVYTQHQKQQLT